MLLLVKLLVATEVKKTRLILLTVSKKWEKVMTPPKKRTGGVPVSNSVSEN